MNTMLNAYPATHRLSRRGVAGLSIITLISISFVGAVALPYFNLTQEQLGRYWPRRWWLLLHITTGIVALLTGPVQLWLGLTNQRTELHRRLGATYIGSIAVSSLAAYYLALHTNLGWVFGAGLASLATAWLTTTGFALVAIRRRLYEQHKEWMLRSYVLTTAFLTFRILFRGLEAVGVGTIGERLAASAWLCWAVPLLITESVLQGRKIFSR
jgi:uncharacterized membrane protein